MSGAEALVGLSLAGNVVTFVDFTAKLCSQIRQYSSALGLPKKLAIQADCLSSLLNILTLLKNKSGEEPLDGVILRHCEDQAKEISIQLESLKGDGRGGWHNWRKAFKSLRHDEELQQMQQTLDSLVTTLSFHLQVDIRTVSKTIEKSTQSIVQRQSEQSAQLSNIHRMAELTLQDYDTITIARQPVWMVPIDRNRNFVGRETLIETLSLQLAPMVDFAPTAVLHGLGGIGKSQIALEYAHIARDRSADICVFWVHAGTTAQFIESFQRIATECRIPGREQAGQDTLQLTRDWLETRCDYSWLMIVDNVDDRAMFFDDLNAYGKALREYIPQTPKGQLLYTTRNRDIGIDLAPNRRPINISPMNIDEARALLGDKVRSDSTEQEQVQLLNELLFLPLAISQATAYMVKRNRTISQYLAMYSESEDMRVKLLNKQAMHHGRGNKPPESILTTWWISFNQIKSENAEAADLLSFMSFLDRQRIPISLLTSDDQDDIDFEEAIGLLEAFSLVTKDSDGLTCSVHSLVCDAVQCWLRDCEHRYDTCAEDAAEALDYKSGDAFDVLMTQPTFAAYLPHIEAVLRSCGTPQNDSEIETRASLHMSMSMYLEVSKDAYKDAEFHAKESVRLWESEKGRDHPSTLDYLAHYASVVSVRNRLSEATDLCREVFERRKRIQGPHHLETLKSLGELGAALHKEELYSEAEEIYHRRLEETYKLIEVDPEDSALKVALYDSRRAIADHLGDRERWEEAIEIYRSLLTAFPESACHMDTLLRLADALESLDNCGEAEDIVHGLRESIVELFGDDHPDTLRVYEHLAHSAIRKGKYDEAEEIGGHIYKLRKASLGDNHHLTLDALVSLADTICFQERNWEAETISMQCLASIQSSLEPHHPRTLYLQVDIAWILQECGKYEEAHQIYVGSLKLAQDIECKSKKIQLRILREMIEGLVHWGRWEEALEYLQQEYDIQLSLIQNNDSILHDSLDKLLRAIDQQDGKRKVLRVAQEVLEMRSTTMGSDNQLTLFALKKLGTLCYHHGIYGVAEDKFQQVVNIKLGAANNCDTLYYESLSWLACTQYIRGKYVQAERNHRREWIVGTILLGSDHPAILIAKRRVACLLAIQYSISNEAVCLLRELIPVSVRVMGPEDHATQAALVQLVDLLTRMGELEEAQGYRERIIETPNGSVITPEKCISEGRSV